MEIDYFKKEISSSGKPYFRNKVTNETQWGFNTYENTNKRLPKGYFRLNVNGKSLYKYNKPVLQSSYFYAYSPREFEILQMSYNDLLKQEEKEPQAEICRRNNLFEKVAHFLKLNGTDNICDESLEFVAKNSKVPLEEIITYIQETERKQLGKKAISTLFSTIKRANSSFSSQISIRELCGVKTREVEAQNALLQITHQFTCIISLYPFTDPVTCSSGHTFEREYITQLIRSSNPVCPLTKLRLTGIIFPCYALKNVIDQFIEKYKNQKGEHWEPILEFCAEYTKGKDKRLKTPIDVFHESDSSESDTDESDSSESDTDESDSAESDSDESDTERQYREMRERQIEREIEENQPGRSEEEIRAYMIYYGNLIESDIPEFIAQSSNSSYAHAIRESSLRYNQLGRTSEQIRAYIINKGSADLGSVAGGGEDIGVGLPALAREFIQGIPDDISTSRESSYRHTDLELNRRYTELRRNARFYGLE
jgi:hypothetical protein